ncbi:MAG: class I SAM-dependent methyltransferase [Promethearchaeota archaeon]
MGRKKKQGVDENWRVSGNRPEDLHVDPGEYWTWDRVGALAKARGQARIQYKITRTALAHFKNEHGLHDFNEGGMGVALDLGFGIGFSAEVLVDEGFMVIGIELLDAMLDQAGTREFIRARKKHGRVHLIMASMEAFPLRRDSVDFILSISAIQWIHGDEKLSRLCMDVASTLKMGGGVALQYYPRSRQEAISLGLQLKGAGLRGGIHIDNAQIPRKRRLYIVLEKGGKKE